MPLILWVGAGIAGLFGIGAATSGIDKIVDDVTGAPQESQVKSAAVPSWVIPTVLIGVGAILAYKYGAKVLKV